MVSSEVYETWSIFLNSNAGATGTEENQDKRKMHQKRILSCCYLYSSNNKSVKCAKDLQENPVKTHTLKRLQKLSENST